MALKGEVVSLLVLESQETQMHHIQPWYSLSIEINSHYKQTKRQILSVKQVCNGRHFSQYGRKSGYPFKVGKYVT